MHTILCGCTAQVWVLFAPSDFYAPVPGVTSLDGKMQTTDTARAQKHISHKRYGCLSIFHGSVVSPPTIPQQIKTRGESGCICRQTMASRTRESATSNIITNHGNTLCRCCSCGISVRAQRFISTVHACGRPGCRIAGPGLIGRYTSHDQSDASGAAALFISEFLCSPRCSMPNPSLQDPVDQVRDPGSGQMLRNERSGQVSSEDLMTEQCAHSIPCVQQTAFKRRTLCCLGAGRPEELAVGCVEQGSLLDRLQFSVAACAGLFNQLR